MHYMDAADFAPSASLNRPYFRIDSRAACGRKLPSRSRLSACGVCGESHDKTGYHCNPRRPARRRRTDVSWIV